MNLNTPSPYIQVLQFFLFLFHAFSPTKASKHLDPVLLMTLTLTYENLTCS